MLCAQRMRSADYLIILMTRLFHQFIFSSLIAWAYSKLTMPGFIGLKLRKSGSGSMSIHFQTWIGHHRAKSQTLTPLRIFGMCWRRLCAVVRLSHHLPSWRKNVCSSGREWMLWHCRSLSKWCHGERVPNNRECSPTKYYSVWRFFLDG